MYFYLSTLAEVNTHSGSVGVNFPIKSNLANPQNESVTLSPSNFINIEGASKIKLTVTIGATIFSANIHHLYVCYGIYYYRNQSIWK